MKVYVNDGAGKAAHDAALMVSALLIDLLAASSPNSSRGQRVAALVSGFSAWPKVCRAMTTLSETAPHSAERGAEADARLRDFIETERVA